MPEKNKTDNIEEKDIENEDSSSSDDSKELKDSEKVEKPSQEGDNTLDENVPFHKHPRFKEVIKARKEAEERAKAAEEEKNELISRLDKIEENISNKTDDIPEWFIEGFGESPELWNKFKQYNQQTREQLKQEVINEIQSKEESKKAQEEESKAFVREELQRLKDEGHVFDDNKLKKLMVDYEIVDFDKAIELYKKLNKISSDKKKKIASKTRSSGKAEGEAKVRTLDDMMKESW